MPYRHWIPSIPRLIRFSGALALSALAALPVLAQDAKTELEVIEVIGVTPTHGVGLPERRIPYNVQTATGEDLARTQSLDLTDFMNRYLGSIAINHAQNNPLQPDLQFRGFTASPLLGLPQGLAVYQNGVRVNEVLGDTVNWDLIPESAIASIDLIGGANPLFGLNTLGGAISVTTKNGFTHPGHRGEFYGGSFERFVTSAESGGNNGTFGYFATANYFDEDGWRDLSPSDALNFFGALSFRNGNRTSADLNFTYADTFLTGNGPSPVELLALERDAIFTAPDITENRMYFIDLQGEHWLNEVTLLSGNIFYRDNDTHSFNGDVTIYEECEVAGVGEFLVEDDVDDDGICDPGDEIIEDQFGNNILAENGFPERDAINNISARDQKNWGASLQATFLPNLFNRKNQLIVGASYSQGFAEFFSTLEIASLTPERSTEGMGTGLFVPEAGTFIDTQARNWSVYVTDTLALTEKLDVTVSARYNNTGIKITDKGGDSILTDPTPALTGEHDYQRLNPAVGITYAFTPALSGYASYSESNRAPTPIELACADPDAPCRLPNAFLADPPLEQVVAENWEGGLRGLYQGNIHWHLGAFRTENSNDIIFISTGGATANIGFFDNVGETQRLGLELGLNGAWQRLDWFVNYSYVRATFETDFRATSPHHPLADAVGEIQVRDGDRIPGIPLHTLKMGGDYAVTPKFSAGAELLYNSGVYLRGDEANLLDTTDSYAIVNLRGEYRFAPKFTLFARINNLFDKEYETFGLLGEPTEIFPTFTDNRFLGPGEPISGFIGIRAEL